MIDTSAHCPWIIMTNKKLTIRDIANMAGVSHMTVSRVLNDASKVRSETRARVLSIVRAHNFTPNPKARAFSSNKSRIIGLLVSDISNPFYAELAGAWRRRLTNMIITSCSAANYP